MYNRSVKMDQETIKKTLQNINSQIPNPYYIGVWYDVVLPDDKKAQAMRTKPGYLRMRKLIHHVIKSPDGTVLHDQGMQYSYFRCNIMTGEITEL